MAAPMDHHRRGKTCDVRPAYRDGRRDKAVKVYTVNLESRYVLVQGVPAIQVTQELLKLFSLYGAIEEYRVLADYPREAFTEVYWIKYASIHAARVAKRKMDDRPFYGSLLHVAYAPEYESVDDTRLKLQQRRRDVAKRLQKLRQESGGETSSCPGDENPVSRQEAASIETRTTQASGTIGPGEPASESAASAADPAQSAGDAIGDAIDDSAAAHGHSGDPLLQQLPEPPRSLPTWQWREAATSRHQHPRLPTAHATLPADFNPYPDGYEPPRPISSDAEPAPTKEAATTEAAAPEGALDVGQAQPGARPKFRLRQDRRDGQAGRRADRPPGSTFLERVAWRKRDPDDRRQARSAESPADLRPHPQGLKRQHPPGDGLSAPAPPRQQRASFTPRQLLGKRRYAEPSLEPGRSGGLGLSEGGRQADTSATASSSTSASTETSSARNQESFDRTVLSIRNQMRNVAQAQSPGPQSSQLGRPVQEEQQQQQQQQQQQRPAHAPAAPAASRQPPTKRPRI